MIKCKCCSTMYYWWTDNIDTLLTGCLNPADLNSHFRFLCITLSSTISYFISSFLSIITAFFKKKLSYNFIWLYSTRTGLLQLSPHLTCTIMTLVTLCALVTFSCLNIVRFLGYVTAILTYKVHCCKTKGALELGDFYKNRG